MRQVRICLAMVVLASSLWACGTATPQAAATEPAASAVATRTQEPAVEPSSIAPANQAATSIAPALPTQEPAAQEARVPGILDFRGEGTQNMLDAPNTVRAGETFTVTITTVGSGCEREGDSAVLLAESSAAVMVYDFTTATRPGVPCTAILKYLPHEVALRFATPGEALIRVWGRKVGQGTPPAGEPTVIERRVSVR